MSNRIAGYLPGDADGPPPDPSDAQSPADPPYLGRLRVIRVVCALMIAFSVVVLCGVTATVAFALGGRALPKNGALLGGVPLLTVIAAVLSMSAVVVATAVGSVMTASGLRTIAASPTDAAGGTTPERVFHLYAAIKFVEFGVAEGTLLVTAVFYHLSADPLMIAFAAGLLLFMAVRFPTAGRVRTWLEAALRKLDGGPTDPADLS